MTGHGDTIEHWVGDFCTSTAFATHGGLVQEYAPQVLVAFLERACAHRGVPPAEIEEADLRPALLEGVAALEIPGSVRADIPALCASFLEELEAGGRLAGGRTLALYVRALRQPYLDAAAGKGTTIRSAGTKLGRNDPCPCGSGRKYKKCCQNR